MLPPPPPKKPVAPDVDLSQMADIPGGTFLMGWKPQKGSPYGDAWFENQHPQHEVTVSDYKMDKREITVTEFALFLSYVGGPAHFHRDQPVEQVDRGYLAVVGTERQPIRQVSWQAAADYCAWAGKRLPTEAEWERAAAGTEQRLYPWGKAAPDCKHAVSLHCQSAPADVGSHPDGATPEGVLDMGGNVAEWTADSYDAYTSDAQTDPTGPDSGTLKAIRGGGFLEAAGYDARSQARWGAPPSAHADSIGFRCAWSSASTLVALRGQLKLPDDVGRKRTARPWAGAAPSPETLAAGLQSPGAIAMVGSSVYVIERGAGKVLAIDASTLATKELQTGLMDPSGIATDGSALYVTDRGAGIIWRLTTGGQTTQLAAGEKLPSLVAAMGDDVYWSTPDAIRHVPSKGGTPQDLATGLDGIGGLAIDANDVFFAELGTSNPLYGRIGRADRVGAGVNTIVPGAVLEGCRPVEVVLSGDGTRLYFARQLPRWPSWGWLCSTKLDGTDYVCHQYTPSPSRIVVRDTTLFWTGAGNVMHGDATPFDPAHTWDVPGVWVSAGGLAAGQGFVVWTDAWSGRLQRVKM